MSDVVEDGALVPYRRTNRLRHLTRRIGDLPTLVTKHSELTRPCSCGCPLIPSDKGECPRCVHGASWLEKAA